MTDPLAVCTKEKQRVVIRFLWLEDVSGAEIHGRLLAQYRVEVFKSVIEKFKSVGTSVTHAEEAGRPSASTTDEKIQQAGEMVMADCYVINDEITCPPRIRVPGLCSLNSNFKLAWIRLFYPELWVK